MCSCACAAVSCHRHEAGLRCALQLTLADILLRLFFVKLNKFITQVLCTKLSKHFCYRPTERDGTFLCMRRVCVCV